jgi:hypothetical protein
LKRNRVVQAAAIAAAVVVVVPTAAGAAGVGPGLGPSIFTVQQLTTGASGSPRVIMKDDTSALAAFATFDVLPSGLINVCTIPGPTATACTQRTTVTPADGEGYLTLVQPTAGTVLMTNGSANFTELFTSTDGGASFGPGVKISRVVNAQNFLALPDGNLLIVGGGDKSGTNPAGAVNAVVVPRDGSGLDTQGMFIPGNYPRAQRSVAYNGGRYVIMGGGFVSAASTETQISYAVYSGAGDPNALANWATATLPISFNDTPAMAEGPSGVVLIATTSQGQVLVSKLSGTTFGAPQDISGPGTDTGYLPNISQDSTGRIVATWQVNSVGLRESISLDGEHWTAPVTINPDREYETDTATAPAGNGVAITRSGSGGVNGAGSYMVTRLYANLFLSLSPTKKTIKQGGSAKLTAKLVDEHAAGIPGAKITLRAGKQSVATGTTSSAGTVSFTVKPKHGTTYTAAYAGTAVNSSYRSQATKVTVKKGK